MKKCILLCAVLCLTAASASGQMFRFGVKGGLTMLSTDLKQVGGRLAIFDPEAGDLWNRFKSKDIGWNLGVMARIDIPLTNLYVQPELVYNHAAYQIFDTAGKSERLRFGNVELPVLLGFKILFLRANVGPVFTLATVDNGDLFRVKRPDVGFQAGLGATLGKITLDVRYHGYFKKPWEDIDLNTVKNTLKANEGFWGVSVGYFF